MWMHQFDESNDTKSRNRLSLVDRVRAIRAYEKTPVYQKIGHMFNCSAKQIRNIIKNKDKVLSLYASGQKTLKSPGNDEKRSKKVALLGRVMQEWVQRARRNRSVGAISYKVLQKVAIDVKQVLNVENFYPSNAWLVNFHNTNVKDQESLPEEPGPTSLDVQEIVDYVQDQEAMENSTEASYHSWLEAGPTWNDDSLASSSLHVPNSVATSRSRTSSSSLYDDQPPSKFPKLEPIDVIELDSDDDGDDPTNGGKSRKNSAITTVEEALRHLKPLEDFALLKEDYRAIGLITQLEMVLTGNKQKENANCSQ